MKYQIFLFLFSVNICLGQHYRPTELLNIDIDSITKLRQEDSSYFSQSVKNLTKGEAIAFADSLFNQVFTSPWGSYITYINAGTLVVIFDNIENDPLKIGEQKRFWLSIRRGFCKYLYKKHISAIQDLNIAIKEDSINPYSYWFRGLAKESLMDYYGAIEDYSAGVGKSKGDDFVKMNCYINLANCFEQLNKNKEAINAYGKAININPNDCYLYLKRGKLKLLVDTKLNACLDLSKSGELGCEDAYEVIRNFCNN